MESMESQQNAPSVRDEAKKSEDQEKAQKPTHSSEEAEASVSRGPLDINVSGPLDTSKQQSTADKTERTCRDRTYSASSGSGAVADNKETINGPLDLERNKNQSSGMGVNTVQVPASDSASMGSTPSLLGSVGAASLAEQRLHAAQTGVLDQRNTGTIDPQQTPVAKPKHTKDTSDISQHDLPPVAPQTPQHLEDSPMIAPSPPLLVAVPVQQSPPNITPQHPTQVEQSQSTETYVAQPQQTLVYQIPGLVTLPVGSATPGVTNDTVNAGGQPQQDQSTGSIIQQAVTPQDQIVGMVGAIPIVKLQGSAVHFVKKKKGRFKFLQETPSVAPIASAGGLQSVAASSPESLPVTSATVQVPPNTALPSKNVSVQQTNQVLPNANPQTFDGSNVPMIKKKGRFVVTNVRDPSSIAKNVPSQQTAPPAALEPQPSSLTAHVQVSQESASQLPEQIHQAKVPSPQTATQGSVPKTGDGKPAPSIPSHVSQPKLDAPTLASAPLAGTQYLQIQANMPQLNGEGIPRPFLYSQYPLQHSQLVESQVQNIQHGQIVETTTQGNLNSTPPPTPAPMVSKGSPSRREPQITALPNTPIPKVAQVPDKPNGPAGPNKKNAPKRPAKAPQSITSGGMYGNLGLGKLSYFLDQMKTEVSEADRVIRHLQTDMKVLRDKNKELEAKNRDLERKVKEESALREKAEARCVEFRKKLRDSVDHRPNRNDTVREDSRMRSDSTENGTFVKSETNQAIVGNLDSHQVSPLQDAKPIADTVPVQQNGNTNAGAHQDKLPTAETAQMMVPPPEAGEKGPYVTPANPSGGLNNQHVPNLNDSSRDLKVGHGRSNSNGSAPKESDMMALKRVPTDLSVKSDIPPTQTLPKKSTPVRKMDGTATPPLPPTSQLPTAATRPTTNGHAQALASRTSSWVDFDPLGPSSVPNLGSDVVPVISIPTNVSLGAVPFGSTASILQNSNGQAYSATEAPLAEHQAALMSENPYVVPITFGMSSIGSNVSSIGSNGAIPQHQLQSGFQVQQPIMLQSPIMLQHVHQGGVPQYASSQQQAQAQPNPHHQQAVPLNPFDPLS